MCRNIRPLNNFQPPATDDEVTAAALQFVRKVSGTTKPSAANQAIFDQAVHEIAHVVRHLIDDLVTTAPPKDRQVEAAKARERAALRYAQRRWHRNGVSRRSQSDLLDHRLSWRRCSASWPTARWSSSAGQGAPPSPGSRITADPTARLGCR